ncbi:MAG: tyrosine-type recombinase/integrase [Acidobacteria bacterium]|nr:tyrosine-type recombinase/integrase [Acidobacteriota bacterium]
MNQIGAERESFLRSVNAGSIAATTHVLPTQAAEGGAIFFGTLAATWEKDYVERVVGGKPLVAASTKQKYRNHLHNHILPRWASTPISRFRAKDVLDWLQEESGSWYMMTDLRNIMSGIFTKTQEWEVLPDTLANPIARVKLPKKWQVYEKRILTEEETVRVLARLHDPNLLICELCLATGARISEVTGLQVKHVNTEIGYVRIEQRHWRGDIDSPKTERSKRTLTLGTLAGRLKGWVESLEDHTPEAWVFPQHDRRKPMWDSGAREGSSTGRKVRFPWSRTAFAAAGEHYLTARGGRLQHRGLPDRRPRQHQNDGRVHGGAVEPAGRVDPPDSGEVNPGGASDPRTGRNPSAEFFPGRSEFPCVGLVPEP